MSNGLLIISSEYNDRKTFLRIFQQNRNIRKLPMFASTIHFVKEIINLNKFQEL